MATAAATVFAIPELLEQILLHTDARTLLLAQRVNRLFRATIKGREELQIKLCFKQYSSAADSHRYKDEHNTMLLGSGRFNCVNYWCLKTSYVHLPHYSSALRMYPSSRSGHEFWEDIIGMNERLGDGRERKDMRDETLQQFVRRLAWIGKSIRWVDEESLRVYNERRQKAQEGTETSDAYDDGQ